MKSEKASATTIDEYIAGVPEDVRAVLERLRETIRRAAPEAEEKISYQIPTYHLNGNLVHFAAFANHVGFYPGADGIARFEKELARYETSKGTVRFPLDEEIPHALVAKIVAYRVEANAKEGKSKRARRRA